MTDKSASAGPPPTVDIQDPLPESNFLWRRVFSFMVSAALIAIIALVVWRIDGTEELRQVALYLCLLLFMVVSYYMIAPSAEQVVKMLQTAKLFASGVRMRQTSTAQNEGGTVTSQTTVSPAVPDTATPLPPAPPAPRGDEDAAPTNRG